MIEWWNGLSFISQIFTAIAVPATIIMIVQSLLLLFGIGLDVDADNDGVPDADGDGLSLITVRGIVAFFSIGGWAGVVADSGGMHLFVSCIIAFAAGLIALIGVAVLFKSAFKLQDSGNLDIINAVGKTGKVYIPVPPKGEGIGKVNVMVQERLVELEALNDSSERIGTNEIVSVVAVIDAETVLVKPEIKKTKETRGGISQWISE